MSRTLILGGTAEAVQLAQGCTALPDLEIITSLAGRTRAPTMPPGEVRIGGFGGADGLAAFLRTRSINRVADATHPFAVQIGRHAEQACRSLGVPRLRLLRPPWRRQPGDRWILVNDLAEAAQRLPRGRRRVLLTIGQRELTAFEGRDHWFLVRTIEPPANPLRNGQWLSARGPFGFEAELALLREHAIEVLVTKASGGEATYPKLAAARALHLPVIMVRRPPPQPGPVVHSVGEALAWLVSAPAQARRLAGRST